MEKAIEPSSNQVLFLVLAFFLSCFVNGERTTNPTDWQPCSIYCNCSLLDDFVVAKCDLTPMEQCESFVLPDETLIL